MRSYDKFLILDRAQSALSMEALFMTIELTKTTYLDLSLMERPSPIFLIMAEVEAKVVSSTISGGPKTVQKPKSEYKGAYKKKKIPEFASPTEMHTVAIFLFAGLKSLR